LGSSKKPGARRYGNSETPGGRFCAISAPLAVSEKTKRDASQFFTNFDSSIHRLQRYNPIKALAG
jgi:hypothetical protein